MKESAPLAGEPLTGYLREMTEPHSPGPQGHADRLSLIVAICAILVSLASFYATYLQAQSSEQQVKAMTWPLMEFTHGNFDTEQRVPILTLSLNNAGVGPAIVKSVTFVFRDKPYYSLNDFLKACCGSEYAAYQQAVADNEFRATDWTLTTSPYNEIILPVGGKNEFLSLPQHEQNAGLWRAIDRERWHLNLEICYCSLLENCYIAVKPGQVFDVAACPASGPD